MGHQHLQPRVSTLTDRRRCLRAEAHAGPELPIPECPHSPAPVRRLRIDADSEVSGPRLSRPAGDRLSPASPS